MALLNRETVREMFDREKIMLSVKADGIPEDRVAEIFGWDAVKKVRESTQINGFTWDSYGGRVCFFYSGFVEAAVYYNVAQLQQGEKKNGNV